MEQEAVPSGLFLDGIGYELEVVSDALEFVLRFSNPTRPRMRQMECALMDTALEVSRLQGDSVSREYL